MEQPNQFNQPNPLNLRHLNDETLWSGAVELARVEIHASLKLIHYLREIQKRNLHAKRGYPSIRTFLIKELGYCESTAGTKVSAMRLLNDVPELEQKIREGKLTITTVSQVQSFLRAEKKDNKIYSKDETLELLEKMEHKSTREVQKELVTLNPEVAPKERVREISADKVEIRIVIDEELRAKLEKLKSIRSHVNPSMTYQEIIAQLVELGLDKWDEVRKHERREQKREQKMEKKRETKQGEMPEKMNETEQAAAPTAATAAPAPKQPAPVGRSRHISPTVKSQVFARDQGECQFVDQVTGRKCASRHLLQVDHVRPFALGGSNEVANLRLLCATHNQMLAAQRFGGDYRKQSVNEPGARDVRATEVRDREVRDREVRAF